MCVKYQYNSNRIILVKITVNICIKIDTHYYTPHIITPYVWDFGYEANSSPETKISGFSHTTITPYKTRKSTPCEQLFWVILGGVSEYFCISKLSEGSPTESRKPRFGGY